jgi:competence protein ComEA
MHRASGRAPGLDLPRADAAAPHGGGAATDGAPVSSLPGPGSDSGGTITVAAGGAVARPGVYVVAAKSRVADVIAAAGGASSDADLDEVNLAAKVSDADRVFVPRQGQPVPAVVGSGGGGGPPGGGGGGGGATGGAATANSPLDLNSATAEQLDALPGVGPATAQAIVAYRQSHGGRFKSVNELLEVRGIGPAKFDALRSLVRVQ